MPYLIRATCHHQSISRYLYGKRRPTCVLVQLHSVANVFLGRTLEIQGKPALFFFYRKRFRIALQKNALRSMEQEKPSDL